MVQGVDGNWYGYFAEVDQAETADATATAGFGLDFGVFCDRNVTIHDGDDLPPVDFTDTNGVAFPFADGDEGATDNTVPADDTCGTAIVDGDVTVTPNNVVRESKDLSFNNAENVGQIGVASDAWPFIQLYNLSAGDNVIIKYNKGGGAQTTTLTFDTVDQFAGADLDRSVYPQRSQVHITVTDLWLNIDPTDEDSWTFGTNADNDLSTNYQVFDENGSSVGDTGANTDTDLADVLGLLMCEDNCVLAFNPDVQETGTLVATLQDNDDSNIDFTFGTTDSQVPIDFETGNSFLGGDMPITITEQGPNSGVFGTYDEGDVSVVIITDDALRGTSASIDYNETAQTILVGFDFATIDIQPIDDEWSSGEEIPVILVDGDANKNSRADEDLDLFNPDNEIIPALSTGSPFTIATGDEFFFIDDYNTGDDGVDATYQVGNPTAVVTAQVPSLFDTDATTGLAGAENASVDAFSARAILNLDEM
jgi:hypothetical protein